MALLSFPVWQVDERAMKRASMVSATLFGLLCCAAPLLSVARAQSGKEGAVLLPGPIHLSGIVTDIHGKPLADTWISHTGIKGPAIKTNAEGQFTIQTQAPAIVFRKAGFSGSYYRVQRDATVEIKLGPASDLRACPSSANCLSLRGFLSAFCLPKVRGITATTQSNDVDYSQRLFMIETTTGRKSGIQHAAGPTWGSGFPLDEDVWSAVEYSETGYRDIGGFLAVDSRGRAANGECWRVLGHAFETASYRKVSHREADLLDNVLDGVCLRRQPSR